MEKETLEEQMYKASVSKAKIDLWHDGFIAGAKWQEERMYSEEDLEYAFNSGKGYGVPDNIKDFNSFINSLNKQD